MDENNTLGIVEHRGFRIIDQGGYVLSYLSHVSVIFLILWAFIYLSVFKRLLFYLLCYINIVVNFLLRYN